MLNDHPKLYLLINFKLKFVQLNFDFVNEPNDMETFANDNKHLSRC